MSVLHTLLETIEKHQKIDIVYEGGSQPGAYREISPLGIKYGMLMAYCHFARSVKYFAIEKISIVDWSQTPALVPWKRRSRRK